MNLKGKTIVITGGTSGIGYELVSQLAAANTLIVIARESERLEQLRQAFPDLQIYPADLASANDIESAAGAILDRHARIDLLINNAAVQYTPTFLDQDFSYESIYHEIAVNFSAVCAMCYLFLPALSNGGEAAIVNINSGLGLVPKSSSAVYCATKGAMNIFSQALRNQLKSTQVTLFQAFIPLVDTPMTTGRGTGKLSAGQAARQILDGIERNKLDNDIGKTKVLRTLNRFVPAVARSLMARS
jgi:uncharacterized oxidoreductase